MARQTFATEQTPFSSSFVSEVGRPNTSLVIDLILKGQSSVAPIGIKGPDLRSHIYMIRSMIWNIFEKYHRDKCDWSACKGLDFVTFAGYDLSTYAGYDCCQFCTYMSEGAAGGVSTSTAKFTASV